jgi:cell division protein ZapA
MQMPQVTVTIAGRVYRMACGDSEEAHLEALAADLDQRIADLRKGFGEIGDMRLHVMAALSLADELHEAKKQAGEAQEQLLIAQKTIQDERVLFEEYEAQFSDDITKECERIVLMARVVDETRHKKSASIDETTNTLKHN